MGTYSNYEFSEKEEGVITLHLPNGSLKTRSEFGAGTEMRAQYLPNIATTPSGPVFFWTF